MYQSRVPKYGPEYEQLLLTAFSQLPYTFQLETSGQAKLFRAKVYGYFRALREENLRLDLIEMADNISATAIGSTLEFRLKKHTWDNVAIRQQLGLADNFAEVGNGTNGNELQVPDLMGTRLAKQLADIRARKANAANIVPGFKTDK